ncbi:MAG: 2TM domain-containing protein [Pseudomonadota bacterium]
MSLIERRKEKGWSQELLAEQAGLSARTVQRIEAGHTASLESLKCLAAVFETSVSTLMEESSMTPATDQAAPSLEDRYEREALAYVENLKGLYIHGLIFALLIPALFMLNLVISPQQLWIQWVVIPWLLALGLQGALTLGWHRFLGPTWEQQTFNRRLNQLRGNQQHANADEIETRAPR